MSKDLPEVLFVTGKGGTGKSFIAGRLAAAAAARGASVCLLHVRRHARDVPAALRGAPPMPSGSVTECTIDWQPSLRAFLVTTLWIERIVDRLLTSRTFSAVASAAPGVADLVALSTIADQIGGSRPTFDLVVVDAPASGHALALATAPERVLSLIAVGPIGTHARKLAALTGDASRFRCVIVTNPEQLPATEASELATKLRASKLDIAGIVVNSALPRRLSEEQEAWSSTRTISGDAALYSMRRERQSEIIAQLAEIGGPLVLFPHLFKEVDPAAEADMEAELLSSLLPDEPDNSAPASGATA